MAYDKHTWTCDEPITVERLNHIEDGIANAGGDCDCGYECTETVTTLTEESVTTELQEGNTAAYGYLSYSQLIDADTIKVTFNGTVYECEKTIGVFGGSSYGAPYDGSTNTYDWSEYPFNIWSGDDGGVYTSIATQTAGTYTIKIEAEETIVTTTPCFDLARGYSCEEEMVTLTEESVTTKQSGLGVVGVLAYREEITADTIKVTFNGTEYTCQKMSGNDYGAPYNTSTRAFDWSEYPFNIMSDNGNNFLATETAGTYTVKIEALKTNTTITSCFEAAVKQANINAGSVLLPKDGVVPINRDSSLASQYTAYANSPLAMRISFADSLSQLAVIRAIVLPDGVLLSNISLTSAHADLRVYNVTANDIAITDSNTHIEVVDFEDPDYVCAVMSSNCSSPGPTPR